MSEKVIAVLGPTASGKTALSVELAKRLNGEIVSCDSMQIYRGMEIGTAKPSSEELAAAPHHLIGVIDPTAVFSAADYVPMAEACIREILNRQRLPIITGGTGFYADALLNGIHFEEKARDENLREELKQKLAEEGIEPLYARLRELDPEAAEKIHPNNKKRVLRALEYCFITEKKFSEQSPEPAPRYQAMLLCLSYRDREALYERIDARVDRMIDAGLLEEAEEYYRRFFADGAPGTSAQAIGYKELFPFFRGEVTLPQAIEAIKRETRRYAKRQLTWFRREKEITWLYADDFPDQAALASFAEKLIHVFLAQDDFSDNRPENEEL